MQEITQPFLFDRDNLKQVFRGRRGKEALKNLGHETISKLCDALIADKSSGAEYVIGLPGVGKTTFALHHFGARAVQTKEEIQAILDDQSSTMVFVTCDVEDEIAHRASKITLLHTSPERLGLQRKDRDANILEGESETAFGRSAGTVVKVTADASTIISRLKTDYADKSRIVIYKSSDPKNWDETKNIPVSNLSEKRKYIAEGVVATSGKLSPFHVAHKHQLKQALSLSQEKGLASFAIIGENSGGEFDLGLTQSERIKIINLVLKGELQFILSGTPKFIKNNQGKIIKIIPEKSRAVLGKERLPAGFLQGSYDELIRDYPEFPKHKDAYALRAFAGYNFINIGNISMQGSDESISATFIRKCLVDGNIDLIKPYLSPEIFSALTSSHNLQVLQKRYSLIQQRDHKLAENKKNRMERYKQKNPLTQEPLVDKKGKLISLTKRFADKCATRKDQSKVMTYIQQIDQMLKKSEKSIRKKYNKLIYSPENTLLFE